MPERVRSAGSREYPLLWDCPVAAFCCIDGRPRFGDASNRAPFPSALGYLGHDWGRFSGVFRDVGAVVLAAERPDRELFERDGEQHGPAATTRRGDTEEYAMPCGRQAWHCPVQRVGICNLHREVPCMSIRCSGSSCHRVS